MRDWYPEIEPYQKFYFKTDPPHELYVEEVGNPKGRPIVFLHGGPGAGISPQHRCFFNPSKYRIVLFDQRGAGKSRPFASLENNTTWDLVADLEKLRAHLQIEQWDVFGGSWGSTLALAYASKHPERVSRLLLRGIFLCRQEEIKWFYQYGAHFLFPDEWQTYSDAIPVNEHTDMIAAYYRRLTSKDPDVQMRAAKAWSEWEGGTLKLLPDAKTKAHFGDTIALSLARIECHYFIHNAFFSSDAYLLDAAERFEKIPGVIVHGRYDVVCPIKNAFDLHQRWPNADFKIIADAGHAADEPGIRSTLIAALDEI